MSTQTVVDQFLAGLAEQDEMAIAALFTAQIDWYVPGHPDLPWTGERSQKGEVPEYFRTLWSQFVAGESVVSLDKVMVDGGDAAIFATFEHTVAANGNRFRTPVAMHLRVQDDKIARMHLYEDTGTVSDAFFGDR